MSRRIRRILLVCSNYDSFALEEEGRLEAQITQEYNELNLSNPPAIIRAESPDEALDMVKAGERFDFVITMNNDGTISVFDFARQMKACCPDMPLVLLTSYSKVVYKRLAETDTSAIDYIFCWNNSTDLFIAIIKLMEDSLNAEQDILQAGVQAILLVEDSVRYYSVYLPMLYRMVLRQNSESIKEALNESQQIQRKRARPKILFATNYEDAVRLYERYRSNLMGVITDIGFVLHKGDRPEEEKSDAGVDLCNLIRSMDPRMPVLMQSSQESMASVAEQLHTGFVVKRSNFLTSEIEDYLCREFGFGDFVLTDKVTHEEIARARDLKELEKVIVTLDDEHLKRLSESNYMSRWLKARGLFALSKTFVGMSFAKSGSAPAHRKALLAAVRDFRIAEGLGVIARFNPANYDGSVWFSRLGNGQIGGKGRGLAFLNNILPKYRLYDKWEGVRVNVPRTLVVSTEYFDRFITENGLQYVINAEIPDAELLSEFVASSLPADLVDALRVFVHTVHKPLAIRSSSALEDSYYQPFAGVYSTYMIPCLENEDQMLRMLCKAIKSVYASVYYAAARSYITATGNLISEEKMGVIIQEVCGSEDKGYFFPTLSGVARSVNFYPIGYEEPSDGVAKVAFGLGKAVVDGDQVLRFTPKYPDHVLQTSTPALTMSDTQQAMFALNLRADKFKTSVDDAVNLERLRIGDCVGFRNLSKVVSTWDRESMRIVDSAFPPGPKYVTFAQILKYNTFPLAEILSELMEIMARETRSNVEIEFAADLDVASDTPAVFNVLQIRPISADSFNSKIDWDQVDCTGAMLNSYSALGTGWINDVHDVIYLRADSFDASRTRQMADEITALNRQMQQQNRPYVLIGYGRWGSSIPTLGVPVKWSDISQARAIVECCLENFRVDPSQGTHFFQNLTSFNCGYINVNPYAREDSFDISALDSQPAEYESDFVRLVHFDKPLVICVDGRGNRAVIKIEK